MTATTDTIQALEQAIQRFGTYQLEDKGAAEVMDVDKVTAQLMRAGIPETIKTLQALSAHEFGEPLLHDLIMVFVEDDNWPELTDALIADPVLQRTYVPWLDGTEE